MCFLWYIKGVKFWSSFVQAARYRVFNFGLYCNRVMVDVSLEIEPLFIYCATRLDSFRGNKISFIDNLLRKYFPEI